MHTLLRSATGIFEVQVKPFPTRPTGGRCSSLRQGGYTTVKVLPFRQAHASGNVYASISLPFDIEDLRDVVRNALSETPFEARVQTLPLGREPLFSEAADILATTQRELMLTWVQQIRLVEPFRERSNY